MPPIANPAYQDAYAENQEYQDKGSCPGLLLLVRIRRHGVAVYLQRQRCDWFEDALEAEVIAQGREY